MRLDELRRGSLLNVHAGAGARVPAASSSVDGAIAYGCHTLATRTRETQLTTREFSDLHGIMAVHDLSRGRDSLVRFARENEDSFPPHSLDVSFRLCFGAPIARRSWSKCTWKSWLGVLMVPVTSMLRGSLRMRTSFPEKPLALRSRTTLSASP